MKYDEDSAEILDATQVSEILKCSKKSVYNLFSEIQEEGKIKAWKDGNKWKCTRTALDRYMSNLSK